jgi:hypothetical protein
LTSELLAKRIVALAARIEHIAGPPEGVAFSRLGCDRCGCTVDLLEGFPKGWTTTGDVERGWIDLCAGCSQ